VGVGRLCFPTRHRGGVEGLRPLHTSAESTMYYQN